MRNQFWIAVAALAIGGVTLPPASEAQTREAADAGEALAQPDTDVDVTDAPAKGEAGTDTIDASAQTHAGADAAAEAPATGEEGAGAAEPTWDAVIQVIEQTLASTSQAETRESADAAAALGTADANADGTGQVAQADAETYVTAPPSEAAIQVMNWVIATHDNGGLPFIVIDKIGAGLFVFDPQGQLLGETPALLGVSNGDESSPDIGERALSAISPEERTTPAGRFAAQYGFASGERRVFWVDYATSVALHPVVTANRRERRLQRLQSPSPEDNRITYGCINVPAPFYADVVQPLFEETGGIVYILPDTMPLEDVFPGLLAQSSARAKAPL